MPDIMRGKAAGRVFPPVSALYKICGATAPNLSAIEKQTARKPVKQSKTCHILRIAQYATKLGKIGTISPIRGTGTIRTHDRFV